MLPILAKPSGVTLKDHTRHLQEEADAYFALRPGPVGKYREHTGNDLVALLKSAIDWHDMGKQHPKWQEACRRDFEKSGGKSGRHLRKTGIRHEMYSLFLAEQHKRILTDPVRAAIAAHHSKLSAKAADRWETDDGGKYASLWKSFTKLKGTIDYHDFDRAITERYRFSGVRALLQLFDHRASAREGGDAIAEFHTFAYTFPHKEPRGVQTVVTELFEEPIGILRAPTGSGKTDAALLWAKHQIDNGRADRLVMAMPTRFTASALAIATAETLSSTGVYHSSAWIQKEDKSKLAEKEHQLARILETPITVTTIDHLCICLIGRREDHHAIFWGLANACVVIDESDFYDAFTQANIVVLLRALRLLKVPVLIMSATVPDSFRSLYERSGGTIAAIVEDTEKANEARCQIKRHEPLVEKPEDIDSILESTKDGQPCIIYANTVARAQAYFDYLIDKGFDDVILYHSRYTEIDKKEIESKLLEMLGKEAWKNEEQHGVAILTQIGELSVNISADRMIADLAPLDRLVQRIGRLSRFGSTVGDILLIRPAKKGTPYPAPYGTYISGQGWVPAEALTQTDTLLLDGVYTRQNLVELVDTLYPAIAEDPERVKRNRQQLEANSIENWLIVPRRQMTIDADEDEEWSCRDIGPQRTIYAQWEGDSIDASDIRTHFRSWDAFNEYAQPRAINLPVYIFQNALKNSWLTEQIILIGDEDSNRKMDEEKIYCINQYYDSERGVSFPEGDD